MKSVWRSGPPARRLETSSSTSTPSWIFTTLTLGTIIGHSLSCFLCRSTHTPSLSSSSLLLAPSFAPSLTFFSFLFLPFSFFLSIPSKIISHYVFRSSSLACLTLTANTHPEFSMWLTAIFDINMERLRGLDLPSYLIMPIQVSEGTEEGEGEGEG